MNWYFVWWSILIPEPLLLGLRKYMRENEAPDHLEEPCDLVTSDQNQVIDLPGMASMVRNMHTVQVGGLSIGIPSTDFVSIFHEVNNLRIREEGGIPHYRLYSSVRCLCLTPDLRDEMLKKMGEQMSAAVEIADWENRQFNAAMGGASSTVVIASEGGRSQAVVMKKPRKANVLISRRPVIDRDIDEV